jgi:hypothetical protein
MPRKYQKKEEPRLCDFNRITCDIPRVKLLKLVDKKRLLDHEEYIFLRAFLWKIELTENKVSHVKSLIEKALLKSIGTHP